MDSAESLTSFAAGLPVNHRPLKIYPDITDYKKRVWWLWENPFYRQ
jgi:hypothetical protein